MDPVKWLPADDSKDWETAIYRQMSGADRVALSFRFNEMIRQTLAEGIRRRHPEYSEDRVRWGVQRLWLNDDELYQRVWPGRELVEP